MDIYIVEDDINIINILEKIIKERNLGNVIGFSRDGLSGEREILELNPDIVLVDLLMPEKDGLNLVKEIKDLKPHIQFVMISQVSSKDMIGKAYEYGVEYFISKPINALEIDSVIKKVIERIKMERAIEQIQKLVTIGDISYKENPNYEKNIEAKIHKIMQRIGIMGEAGSQDIVDIVSYLIKNDKSMKDFTITELLSKYTDNPKSMEQRIRRTAAIGLSNLANLGLEDYMNEIFVEYSNGLYSFEQVKLEMDFLRGKSKKRGAVNLKKFIDGMAFYSLHE
ncbi:MAG: response regulator [Tissierellia bacterium]|nr:response regulator [Tissierellia bacterium]